jgi:hypothetical protein
MVVLLPCARKPGRSYHSYNRAVIKIHPDLPALPFRPTAINWLRDWGVRVQVRDARSRSGGGFWWPEKKLVDLFTTQEEAAIHEVAHAWWHPRRLEGTNAAEMIVATVKLSEERDPRYERAAQIARYYVYGIPSQKDEGSETGWWMGQLVNQGNDWECYAGLASAVMGDISKLPPYVRRFYVDLFDEPDER